MRSVRRRPNFVSLITFSLAWCLLVFMLALPFTVSAAPVTYETVRVAPGQYAPSGVQVPITQNVKTPGVSRFHQIVPVANPSTVGKLGRSLIRGGGIGLAVVAAIEGVGYLVDQATGEIKKEVIVLGNPTGNSVWGQNMTVQSAPLSNVSTLESFCSGAQFCVIYAATPNVTATARRWNCPLPDYPVGYNYNNPTGSPPVYEGRCYVATSTIPETSTIIDLDPSDYQVIDNKIDNDFSLSDKTRIITTTLSNTPLSGTVDSDNYPVVITSPNPQTEQLLEDWPELREALRRLVNARISDYLKTQNPELELSPDDQAIVDTGTIAPPVEQHEITVDLELPAFCEWASWLCAPFVGGDQPDVPMLDLEAPNYDSGLPTGGTCPQPYTFNTGFTGPMEISFQPACDLATAIRTPLIAISYLMAGFIVVGVRR